MDVNHLVPFKSNGSGTMHSDLSRSGSEPDSLLDLYGRPRSHVDNVDQLVKADNQDPLYLDDEDPEQSRWIHRDKLALIESHEMQEAGIKYPRFPRSSSRSNRKKSHIRQQSHERSSNDPSQPDPGSHDFEEETPQSGGLSNGHGEEQTPEDEAIFDLRTSDEIARESYSVSVASPMYRQPGTRSSSSRIPLPKSSPLPIPQEHIERNTPLTRTRGASGNWSIGDDDGMVYKKGRGRSLSAGSQMLLDDGEPLSDASNSAAHDGVNGNPSTSPTKRLGLKAGQVTSSNARKATGALRNVSDPQKTRSASNTYRSSPNQRPKSRSGLEPRPATAINRPEGDPPWLATMYKPDPRLPPDQQILPTHAKRMQQEKDRSLGHPSGDFASPAEHAEDKSYATSPSSVHPEINGRADPIGDEPGWPLRALPAAKTDGSAEPVGAAEQHAGYSTIPKVQNTPPIGKAAQATAAGSQTAPESSTAKPQEKPEKTGRACGCCVLM